MQEKKISTFAFLDIEATGIPSYDYNPKATDLCIIAVERQHLVSNSCQREPKITNKIRLHINPKKTTTNFSLQLTGLSTLDSNPEKINEDFVQLLLLFLKRLPHPVCLVAHNGNGFDFRLLQAEIKSIGCSLPDDILCADTYFAFQSILRDKFTKSNVSKGPSEKNSRVNPSDNCTVATCSTLGKPTILNRLGNQSFNGDNDNSDDSSSSTNEHVRRNVIMNSKSVCHHVDEDEVEVIAIDDRRNDSPLDVSTAKQNGDKEVSCYPVIDLTEDSSMDEESDEESDDSNIIIENDGPAERKKKREKFEKEKGETTEILEQKDKEMGEIDDEEQKQDEKTEKKEEKSADKDENDEKSAEKDEKCVENDEKSGKSDEKSGKIDENSDEISAPVEKTEEIVEKSDKEAKEPGKVAEGSDSTPVEAEKPVQTNGVATDDSNSASNKRAREQDNELSNSANNTKKSKTESETILSTVEDPMTKTCNSDITHSSVIKTKSCVVQETSDRIAKLKFAHNFSLSALHLALTGRALGKDSTDAERDAAALARVCQAAGNLFCEWTDTNAVSINTIQSFW